MARKRKVSEVLDTDITCYYCDKAIPDNAMKCPHCGKMFSIAKKILTFSIALIIISAALGFMAYDYYNQTGQEGYEGDDDIIPPDSSDSKVIRIRMYTDKAPITSKNFIDLARNGDYDGTIFHRVIANFMIQGGDFTNFDGTGGHAAEYHDGLGDPNNPDSWLLPDEFHQDLSNVRGTLSMANTGQLDSGGSQFFINTVDNVNLDYTTEPSKHAVFGVVVSGMDIVDEIGGTAVGTNDRPIGPVTIESATVTESGGITYVSLKMDF